MNVSGAATQSFSFSQQTAVWQRAVVTSQTSASTSPQAPPSPVEAPAPDPVVTADPAPQADRARISGRAKALFSALDENRDGRLTGEEFVSGARDILTLAGEGDEVSDDQLERLFDRIDRNDNGVVGRRELRRALARAVRHYGHEQDPATDGTTAGTDAVRTIQPVSAPRVVQVPPSAIGQTTASSEAASAPSVKRVVQVAASPVKPSAESATATTPAKAPTSSTPSGPVSLPAGAFTATLTSVTYVSIAIYRYTSISLSSSAPEAPSSPALAA